MTEAPNPLLVNMDEQSQYKGTLFIEAYDSLIDSIGSGAQDIADLTFNAIGAVASTVSLVLDPFGSLLGAGLGWLMEHISFLREALDQLMGDPDVINANVTDTKAKAADLRVLAEDHRSTLAPGDGWTGASSEKYQASMDTMGKELDCLANAVETKAKVVSIMGMLVTVVRDIVRDMIAQFLGSVIANAAIGLVGAFFTFGASLGYAIGQIVREALEVAATISGKVRKVVQALGDLMGKIGNLDDVMAKVGKGWDRFDNAADAAEISYEAYKAAGSVDETIDKALKDDAEKDKLNAAYDKQKEETAKYQAAKNAEETQSDDVQKANADMSAASDATKAAAGDVTRTAGDVTRAAGEVDRANADANRAVDAMNRAAKSGDQAAYAAAKQKYDTATLTAGAAKTEYDAAKQKYDAADAKYDAAKTKVADAAATVAREQREMSDAAKKSYEALQASKPSSDAATKAHEEYVKYTGGTPDADLTAKNEAARVANESFEKANVDYMDKNAAAAEANAKAFKSGLDADIQAAEKASNEAAEAGKKLDSAAAEARSAGDAAAKAAQPPGDGGAPDPGKPDDPLAHARKVAGSTSFGDTFKDGAFLGEPGRPGDSKPGPSAPPVKH